MNIPVPAFILKVAYKNSQVPFAKYFMFEVRNIVVVMNTELHVELLWCTEKRFKNAESRFCPSAPN